MDLFIIQVGLSEACWLTLLGVKWPKVKKLRALTITALVPESHHLASMSLKLLLLAD